MHLNTARLARGQVEIQTQDIFHEEMMSSQLIRRRQRRKQRDMQALQEDHGRQTSTTDIVHVFSKYIRRKYCPIDVEGEFISKMLQSGYGRLSDD